MDEIPVAEAARRLGLTEWAVRKMITAGRLPNRARSGPAVVAAADVVRIRSHRRTEALSRRRDLTGFAQEIRQLLHPASARTAGLPEGTVYLLPTGRDALKVLPPDAFAVFGRDVLEAAAVRDQLRRDGGCPTCWAHMASRVHQTHPPENGEAYRALLGEPCPVDVQRFAEQAAGRRRDADRLRAAEAASRQAAQQEYARQEFSAAEAAVRAAVSRRTAAARAYSALDPSVARQAGVQARRRAGFAASGDLPCGCSRDVYCAGHAAAFGTSDRRAARR
ncbi:hypothetical protein [Streptomyces plumbiresistens]|uniref:Helix-turn-helix domain-containing protein n=1 Tax=Streptomyces plumbiresistens TaxID=511811 RepID=A0ABP7ST27_9ACTN